MLLLLLVYFIFLVFYGMVSYAIAFHLIRYRITGDKSKLVLTMYLILTAIIVIGSFLYLRPS